MSPSTNTDSNRPLAEEGIPSEVQASSTEFDLREYMDIFWRRKVLFIIVFFAIVILAAAYTFTRPKVFEATEKLVVAGKAPQFMGNVDPLVAQISSITDSQTVDTAVEIINSDPLLRTALSTFNKDEQINGFGVDPTQPFQVPLWSYSISSAKDTSVIDIVARSYKPKLAARFADSIAQAYLSQDLAINNQPTSQGLTYVTTALAEQRAQLKEATAKMAAFQHERSFVAPDVQVEKAAEEIATLEALVYTTQGQLQADSLREQKLDNQIRAQNPEIQAGRTIAENPEFTLVRAHLVDLRSQLAQAQQTYTDANDIVKGLKNQITEYEQKMRTLAQKLVTQTSMQANPLTENLNVAYAQAVVSRIVDEDQLSFVRGVLQSRQTKFAKYPEDQRDYMDLKQSVDEHTANVTSLQQQLFQLTTAQKSNVSGAAVCAVALPPVLPSYPKVVLNMLAAGFLAVLLAAGAVLLQEKLDTRVHDPAVATRIAGLTLLAAVPEAKPLTAGSQVLAGRVESNHAFLEAFRLLRNNIAFSSPDKNLKTLAVTSASKSEGKTTVSVNLAIAMAMDGKRVLIIDADLRRPSVHTILDLPRESGLTTVVKGIGTLDDSILATPFENLYALPSGPLPPNPTEFLNSQQARRVFAEAASKFDVVIVDSPPSSGLSDFQVISTFADGAILVIALDSTFKQQLHAAMHMLRQANAPMLGTVLNRVKYKRGAYGYYSSYYYAYYSYYGEDVEKNGKRKKKRRKNPNKENGH